MSKICHYSRPLNHNVSLLTLISILLDLASRVDPDEMPHDAAFHPGLHCL